MKGALLIASLLGLTSCLDRAAGGSGDTDNPEIELAWQGPGGPAVLSGSLRLYRADHDPSTEGAPLLAKDLKQARSARITFRELESAYLADSASRRTGWEEMDFNLLVADGTHENLLGGFRLSFREGGARLIRMDGRDTVASVTRGGMRIDFRLDTALLGVSGKAFGPGMEGEAGAVHLPGTPYRAPVKEGIFRFERMARGSYLLVAEMETGERRVATTPFLPDSSLQTLTWAKERLEYRVDAQGLRIRGVDSTNPMIYDNDLLAGGVDDEYLFARASLGASLKGLVITRVMLHATTPDTLPGGYLFTLQQGMDEAIQCVARARRSGMRNLPDPVPGADGRLERPASGLIGDTRAVSSEGARLMVREASLATPRKPLIVFVGGGQATTVANAYLLDPSIARRMVVIGTGLDSSSKNPWATYVLAKRCHVVNFGESRLWWPQRPEATVLPPERFAELPVNETTRHLDSLARRNREDNLSPTAPRRDGGFNDGAGLFLVFAPRSWKGVARISVGPDLVPADQPEGRPFDLLHAVDCGFPAMTDEFFSTFAHPRVFSGP